MTSDDDLYEVLGVLPDAEQVVITAAFRALVSKYHPDRWTGDPAQAHAQTVRLNKAYEVLGDPAKRSAYDRTRTASNGHQFAGDEDTQEAAFGEALSELEERWQIAVSVMPALAHLRASLAKTSHRLAFAFVQTLMQTRSFDQADHLARHMEQAFLERHFGTNPKVVAYARELITLGERGAVRALNRLVEVMGSALDEPIIRRIDQDFCIPEKRSDRLKEQVERQKKERAQGDSVSAELNRKLRIESLQNELLDDPRDSKATRLAESFGYHVRTENPGWFAPIRYLVREPEATEELAFDNPHKFVKWTIDNLARRTP